MIVVSRDILYVGLRSVLLTTRKLMLDRAKYSLRWSTTLEEAVQLLWDQAFPLVIFGELLTTSEALQLAEIVRERSPESRVLSTGRQPVRKIVDGYLEPQDSPDAFLRLVGSLLMQAHGHPEISGKYVAYVDADRRYIWVSDGFCQLLGYIREELLGKTIEQVTYPQTSEVPVQFEEFRKAGRQQGKFILQHRDGSAVPVRFKAQVLPDGCMVSVLTPAAKQNI
jgi:PAS domain S-box-containing protein